MLCLKSSVWRIQMKNFIEAKGSGIPKFPRDSRVVFLGDSLTGGSLWVQMIFDYYLKAFPDENIRIYDCGVGMGTADYGLGTLEEDTLTYDPTHVVIMYGFNDIMGGIGGPEQKMDAFCSNMKKLTDTLLAKGIVVYFMSEPSNEKFLDSGERISELAAVATERIAGEYNIPLCNFYRILSPFFNEKMRLPDEVHFNELGNAVLARTFLHLQGFDGFTPEDDGFYDLFEMSYDLDHRKIFSDKIRRTWLAMRSISTTGDTTEAKIQRLYKRLVTRGDGAWDEFCYYRAIDFIEMYPHLKFYREELDRTTDKMIAKAMGKTTD